MYREERKEEAGTCLCGKQNIYKKSDVLVQRQDTDKDRQTHIKRRRKQVNIPRQDLPDQPPLALPQPGTCSRKKEEEKGVNFASSLHIHPIKKLKERR
jgi:hypothetical protein